jgi:hypothetical protein
MINIKPGFNKQVTESGAEGQWIDGDFVRFRYGLPEKIGGWQALVNSTLAGAARAQHTFSDLDGRTYAAIGTNKLLVIYHEGQFYDVTPIDTDKSQTGCDITTTLTSDIVTITTPTPHNLAIGDLVTFENAGSFSGTSYTAADFDDVVFEVQTVPTTSTFTIKMPSAEATGSVTNNGTLDLLPYVVIGPNLETYGYGWGVSTWGASTWGTARTTQQVTLEAGSWSLDNYGQKLIATIQNGKTFEWDPINVSGTALETRATVLASNPTASIMTLVSDRDRHLFHFGTETTIGTPSTQDRLFVRFSNQEDPSTYQPTATNTAGTFRLDSGSKIVGAVVAKDYIFVLTDTSAYVIQFVGPPFTFSVRQVGSNCGLLGKHALAYSNGVVYWMSNEGGFFAFDGTVKAIPCLVEDFVFTTSDGAPGINYVGGEITYAGHNSLYNEIVWFYPSASTFQIDRCVTYNFVEQTWTTGTLARSTYADSAVYDAPYATEFKINTIPSFPTIQGATADLGATNYYEHEIGNNELTPAGVTNSIDAYIQSGDFSLHDQGDAEFLLKIRRFVPDFKVLTGNAKITLNLRNYPTDPSSSSSLGPFTINSSTDKVDTRARSRLMSIKIENDSINQNWRYGTMRLDLQPDGRR